MRADDAMRLITDRLDGVLVPLGFAAGQTGASADRGQVIWCHGTRRAADGGCVDLVIEVAPDPDWRVVDVRWWDLPSERWHLAFERGQALPAQLDDLARELPGRLATR